jgi:hypothetical protein
MSIFVRGAGGGRAGLGCIGTGGCPARYLWGRCCLLRLQLRSFARAGSLQFPARPTLSRSLSTGLFSLSTPTTQVGGGRASIRFDYLFLFSTREASVRRRRIYCSVRCLISTRGGSALYCRCEACWRA